MGGWNVKENLESDLIGLVTVNSVEIFRHFTFWRHGTRLASFLIEPDNYLFWGASFKLIKNLAALAPKKLQGFESLLYHCYTLQEWRNRNLIAHEELDV